ncbi:hypothetical protein [Spongiactinospora sp. TRM90649]|uniref:hypothetical protein n=1 Tax=Spongiactinospora sp. TRM90649 TaxID=3031114 RepID=UPI0023F84779|nr:hypothetical protein [Spongiactinospora sp. TRM90649]MDF5754724.1 hypothetical protein [Spongiactinospora sp. TRM90649]
MIEDQETRLRSALGRAAERAPKAPSRFPAEVVTRAHRRRTARNALLAAVCVTAVAVPLGLAAARDAGPAEVATGTVVPSVTAGPQDYTADEFRISEFLQIEDPSQRRPITFWFAKGDKGTLLCRRIKGGTDTGVPWCGQPLQPGEMAEQGATPPGPATGLVLYYGTTTDKAVTVTAVTGADKVSGKIHRLKDAPLDVWTVAVPSGRTVQGFEFANSQGTLLAEFTRTDPRSPEATDKRLDPAVEMPGRLVAGLYETPAKTLQWTLDGRPVGTHILTRGAFLTDLDGKPSSAELRTDKERWFGITNSATARVELVFKDGTTVRAETRPNPWKLGDFRLFAGTRRHTDDAYRDASRLVGYDAEGGELWRQVYGGGS